MIQSAVPLRAEVEHQAIDVLSIYQQDLPESELALIANMLEGEDNQGDVDGFEQGEEYSVESKHGQEDGELRHTDMRHSIQEVLQHKQQNTKVYHDVMILDELTRLLRTMSADKKPTLPSAGGPGGLTRTESRILELLSHTSFKSLSRVLAILELAELSGFQVDAGLERHRDYVVKSMKMSSYGEAASKNMLPMIQCNCKKYSTAFHQQVNVILAQKLQQYQVLKTQPSSSKTHRSSGNSVQGAPSSTMNLLQSELEIRQRLLLAYEKLSEIHEIHIASEAQASSHANNGNMNSPMRDDATTLCRQNNYRAEALCWTLRQVKKLEHVQHHHQVGMRSGPSSPMLASTATSPMHPSGTLSPMNNRQSMASSVSGVTSNSTSNTNISANLSQSVVPTFRSDSIVVLSDTTANSGSNSNSGRHALSPKPLGKVENKSTVLHNLSASTASDTTTTAPAPQSPGRKATSSFVPHDLNPGSNSSTHEALEFMNFSMFRIFHGERNDVESTSSTKNISFTIRIDDIADILTQANTLGSSEQHVMEHSSLTITNFCSVDIMHFYNTGAGMNTNKTDGAEDQEVGGDEEEEEEDHDSSRMDFIEVSLSHPQIALYMLIYFFQPLLSGDLVVYRGFTTALKYEGHVLSGPQALKELLPGFLHYISAQSLSVVVDELLTKKLSTSPFQR